MTSLLDRARRGERLDDLDIVDMHCHVGRCGFAVPDASAAALVRAMDRIGIRQCVVSPLVRGHAQDGGNDEVAEAMRRYPGRLLGYVRPWPRSAAAVERQVARRIDEGFVGIKLHSVIGFAYDAPAYEPAYAIADQRRLPLLFHTWGGEDLDEIRRIAHRHGGAACLLAHAGSRDEGRYLDLVRDTPNVYLDTCLSYAPRGLIERLVEAVGPDRIVSGSDCTFINMAQQIGKVLGARIDDQAKRAILSANARKILARRV